MFAQLLTAASIFKGHTSTENHHTTINFSFTWYKNEIYASQGSHIFICKEWDIIAFTVPGSRQLFLKTYFSLE